MGTSSANGPLRSWPVRTSYLAKCRGHYDDMAFELPPGEGGPVMSACVADDVEGPCHVDQQQPLPVSDDHLHLAWGDLGHLGHGHKSRHGPPLLLRLSWILHAPCGTPPTTLPPLH